MREPKSYDGLIFGILKVILIHVIAALNLFSYVHPHPNSHNKPIPRFPDHGRGDRLNPWSASSLGV